MLDQVSQHSSVNIITREGKVGDTADRFDSNSKRGSKQEASSGQPSGYHPLKVLPKMVQGATSLSFQTQ